MQYFVYVLTTRTLTGPYSFKEAARLWDDIAHDELDPIIFQLVVDEEGRIVDK